MNICADNYSLTLGKFKLHSIDFEIPAGSVFAIIGETGSGKSVLLESLAGFYEPSAGKVTYDGKNVLDIPLEHRKIGYVYQDYGLFPHMTVAENIEFGLRMHGEKKKARRAKALELMKLLKVDHLCDRFPGTLSGGEQQRTALARALILKPEVLFMDEPFSALDPNTKQNMYQLIESVHQQFGCTIVFVTHDFREAERLADFVGVMIKGTLKTICSAEELRSEQQDAEVVRFLGLVQKNAQVEC